MAVRMLKEQEEKISVEKFISLYEDGYYGGITPKDDSTPCPWDPDISIEGDNVVIEGHMGPSGYGNCICKLPKKDFFKKFNIM